jgi:hypothetical protein
MLNRTHTHTCELKNHIDILESVPGEIGDSEFGIRIYIRSLRVSVHRHHQISLGTECPDASIRSIRANRHLLLQQLVFKVGV